MKIKQIIKSNKKGFTLVELIVVLAVVSVLAVVGTNTFRQYITRQKESDAISMCRISVAAAQGFLDEMIIRNDTTTKVDGAQMIQSIEDLTELTGTIIEIESNETREYITKLVYQYSPEIFAVYQDDTYQIMTEQSFSSNINAFLKKSWDLLPDVLGKNQLWWVLRDNFADSLPEKTFPALSSAEKAILNKVSQSTLDQLSWKPTIISSSALTTQTTLDDISDIIMIASVERSNMAYMIYYNGFYYYHTNPSGLQNNFHVSDQGTFDLSTLETGGTLDCWVKYN